MLTVSDWTACYWHKDQASPYSWNSFLCCCGDNSVTNLLFYFTLYLWRIYCWGTYSVNIKSIGHKLEDLNHRHNLTADLQEYFSYILEFCL